MTAKQVLRFLSLTLLAALTAAPFYFAEGALHIHRRWIPDARAADYLAARNGATWQPVEIRAADGVVLRAWFLRPNEWNGGAVLLLHGVADTRLGMTGHLEYLLLNGYATLMPEARGHGSSGGDLVTYGLREARDTALWANWMLSQPGVQRIYGLGESMGAAVLIQSLALHPPFRAIVAECPFATFEDVAKYRVGRLVPGAAWLVVPLAAWYSRLRYGVDVMQASPIVAIRATKTPVLLIHGTANVNIPEIESRKLHEANPEVTELWEVAGAAHTGAMVADPQAYRRRVLNWFGEH